MLSVLFICACAAAGVGPLRAHTHSTDAHTHSMDAHTHSTDAHSDHPRHRRSEMSTKPASAEPVTTSPSGVLRGSWMQTRRGRQFQAYRGVRYAEPPVGELRFQPPKLIEHYDTEVNATEEGPACPQHTRRDYRVCEDCLRLNVYTPDTKGKYPVIVFIHAGGFYSVSGRSDVAGPQYLLDRDLVVVTINYRLASLGFLSTGDKLAPGNNGFKDQVAALKWVQRNVASFGGDPGLVTIAGYSAGSFSVMLHMISPMSKGLFHRAISMSGSPISQVEIPAHQKHLAVKQAKLLSCPADSSTVILDCLKTKSSEELGNSRVGFPEFANDPVLVWLPIVEPDFGQERFLTMQSLEAVRQGKMHSVPFIVSQTTDEFFWKAFTVLNNDSYMNTMNEEWHRIAPISFLLPAEGAAHAADRLKQVYLKDKPLTNDTDTANALGNLYSDAVIGFGVHRMANLMCRHSPHPVYYYEFAYIGNHSHREDPVTNKPLGVAHHDDLIYLFSIQALFPDIEVSDSRDSMMVDKMTALWYNFARYGDPNPRGDTPELGSLSWPAMKPDQRRYLRIGDEFSVQQNLFEDRFKVWEELYPIQY